MDRGGIPLEVLVKVPHSGGIERPLDLCGTGLDFRPEGRCVVRTQALGDGPSRMRPVESAADTMSRI